ncbi:type II secretion system protein GspH [Hydrogenophaga sp. PAMC20947]|uniref:type II secretion system protein GspH n=1 Tax=Hydrogenophaga sp. PAMC20947 TaxID=2565558 RepID=UPI00109DF0FB|nr:type II secretion system protein GspH [Hydrogenophaga sp. PAMC20947]QCB48715.1 type II secretion system protein GspH [Hydrogenophaga sp. PAMC20947]
MVVVAIIALATAGVSLALRDDDGGRLETEALRLSALLESARAQSRSSGVPIYWRATPDGFEFLGLSSKGKALDDLMGMRHWLQTETVAQVVLPADAGNLVLGPEPLIAAQRVALQLGDRQLILATDGLAPFAVLPAGVAP